MGLDLYFYKKSKGVLTKETTLVEEYGSCRNYHVLGQLLLESSELEEPGEKFTYVGHCKDNEFDLVGDEELLERINLKKLKGKYKLLPKATDSFDRRQRKAARELMKLLGTYGPDESLYFYYNY